MTRARSATTAPAPSTLGVATSAVTWLPRSIGASSARPGSTSSGLSGVLAQVRTSCTEVAPAETATSRSEWGTPSEAVKRVAATRAGRGSSTGMESGRIRTRDDTTSSSTGSKRTSSSLPELATAT